MGCLKLNHSEENTPLQVSHRSESLRLKSSAGLIRYGYQGQYAEEDTVTGFSSFELRMYDPVIGRWLQVDPMREFASPYNGMGNNPIKSVDPDGGCTTCIQLANVVRDMTNNPYFGIRALGFDGAILDEIIVNGVNSSVSNGVLGGSNITLDRISGLERGRPSMSTVDALILHRTVSTNYPGTWMRGLNKAKGAHFYVDKDGTTYQTASLDTSVAHLYNNSKQMYADYYEVLVNTNTIGIEVVGNYSDGKWEPLTAEQISATSMLVQQLQNHYDVHSNNVYPHETVQRKTVGEGQTVLDAITILK